jgi:hypothetical protein
MNATLHRLFTGNVLVNALLGASATWATAAATPAGTHAAPVVAKPPATVAAKAPDPAKPSSPQERTKYCHHQATVQRLGGAARQDFITRCLKSP